MKLLINPFLQADGPDMLYIACPRAEGEPVESVQDLFVAAELILESPSFIAGLPWAGRGRCGENREQRDGGTQMPHITLNAAEGRKFTYNSPYNVIRLDCGLLD